MKFVTIVLVAMLIGAGQVFAADDQDRTNAAYARLHAKQAAATQPATITNAELQELQSELTALRVENAKLRELLTKAAEAIQAAQVPAQQAAAPQEKKRTKVKLPIVPPHQPQIGALEMPVGSPLDFTLDMEVGSVGWVTTPRVVEVIDGNNAVIEVFQGTPNGQRLVGRDRQVLMRGVSTDGMADDTRLLPDRWPARYFEVTGTDKVNGRTYFVIEMVKR